MNSFEYYVLFEDLDLYHGYTKSEYQKHYRARLRAIDAIVKKFPTFRINFLLDNNRYIYKHNDEFLTAVTDIVKDADLSTNIYAGNFQSYEERGVSDRIFLITNNKQIAVQLRFLWTNNSIYTLNV